MATGWGRSTWGADVFGGTSVDVSVTGNVGTLSLGAETVVAAANVAVTGNVGTSALGTESLSTNNILDVTGFVGTSALGSVTPKANADVTITEGFEITSALNTVNVWGQVAQGISTTYTPVSTTQTPNWQEVA